MILHGGVLHSGHNTGANIAIAVNWADMVHWPSHGREFERSMCEE